ncbi:MAG: hypothetical protein IJ225_12320 [Solobacterium sp.]|nr:hypothetical protein [Solobacterium sp.]
MNYENLYEELTTTEKDLSSAIKDIQKYSKQIIKSTQTGDLKDIDKALKSLKSALDATRDSYKEIKSSVDGFDRFAYINDGQFSDQMLEECKLQGVDAKDLGGLTYELFPNKVSINSETLDITVDKKKYSYLRPKALVETIKAGQEKLKKEPFNADRFINELADAYDTVILRGKKKSPSAEVKLSDVYLRMAPTARAKKEYDKQTFAFDLARLYASDVRSTKDGRALNLSTSRDNKNAIRFLDQNGHEQYYALISFI